MLCRHRKKSRGNNQTDGKKERQPTDVWREKREKNASNNLKKSICPIIPFHCLVAPSNQGWFNLFSLRFISVQCGLAGLTAGQPRLSRTGCSQRLYCSSSTSPHVGHRRHPTLLNVGTFRCLTFQTRTQSSRTRLVYPLH